MVDIENARHILGKSFIGLKELGSIASKLHIPLPLDAPDIPFPYTKELLEANRKSHLLVLGIDRDSEGNPLTVVQFRKLFGTDPVRTEPCMYNQDWYLKEKFANETTLENRWYLVSKEVLDTTRAVDPNKIIKSLPEYRKFPTAILTTFVFFAYYFLTGGKMLWKHDFIWCEDTDANGDRIYTGRYVDPKGINKNGFNVHRHLNIRDCHGAISVFG